MPEDLSKRSQYGDLKKRTDMMSAVSIEAPNQTRGAPNQPQPVDLGRPDVIEPGSTPVGDVTAQVDLSPDDEDTLRVGSLLMGLAGRPNLTPAIQQFIEDFKDNLGEKRARPNPVGDVQPNNTLHPNAESKTQ